VVLATVAGADTADPATAPTVVPAPRGGPGGGEDAAPPAAMAPGSRA
jgi:hypothetical protein